MGPTWGRQDPGGPHVGHMNFVIWVLNGGWGLSYEIAFRWMPLDSTDDKSTLVQVMAWCCQATCHYLNQCWPRSLTPYGITRPQWVNFDNAFLSIWYQEYLNQRNEILIWWAETYTNQTIRQQTYSKVRYDYEITRRNIGGPLKNLTTSVSFHDSSEPPLIARSCRPQTGPMLAPWTLLSGVQVNFAVPSSSHNVIIKPLGKQNTAVIVLDEWLVLPLNKLCIHLTLT